MSFKLSHHYIRNKDFFYVPNYSENYLPFNFLKIFQNHSVLTELHNSIRLFYYYVSLLFYIITNGLDSLCIKLNM